ncbi:MAG: ATPase Beggiatoa sp PS gb [Candidatus Magnetoglobus multicellularis str. Araruama]|uniref:ATPase Beggiatoa sp PS gb n=1 Tax=Candidatus Magnetoglobus multicellularis str. Araruama TaxID=890399 RepID=A0A1V1P0Q6_9BACT|nr:MAG: ATPase Beggiatoa sp PS gb [Candidatus Magnetoglobus multicellularis str. Araruama]
MIKDIRIKNYKSIQKLKITTGQLTVFIGENGSGKTNILEAIALASAAANDKLDNEFLAARGIRVTDPRFMRAAFNCENFSEDIYIRLTGANDSYFECLLKNDNEPYSKWTINNAKNFQLDQNPKSIIEKLKLHNFLIYSPENNALRVFEKEGQIQPLGINGEGLFKLLKVLASEENNIRLEVIKEKLKVIGWFEDFEIPDSLFESIELIKIKDKYLHEKFSYINQKASNEGFLFLLFYFALFVSNKTPDLFAIDNIDASLNPKLCWHLTKELVKLAKQYNKQVILTTHNPAILDGLNLDDPQQKLYVVFRNKLGYTKIKQIEKPKSDGQEPVRLSEAFLRGYIGGLPKGF